MSEVVAIQNQSLLDIAVQEAGTVEAVFEIASLNGLSITDKIAPGTVLLLSETMPTDNDILNYYKSKGIRPATADNHKEPSGIGFWTIGEDFIVQ